MKDLNITPLIKRYQTLKNSPFRDPDGIGTEAYIKLQQLLYKYWEMNIGDDDFKSYLDEKHDYKSTTETMCNYWVAGAKYTYFDKWIEKELTKL